jgi:plasmid maintenance system antidote protein VapI
MHEDNMELKLHTPSNNTTTQSASEFRRMIEREMLTISELDHVASNINSIRLTISAGQGVGKFMELAIVLCINTYSKELEAKQLALYNSKIHSDIIIHQKGTITDDHITRTLKKHKTSEDFFHNLSLQCNNRVTGASIKNYVNNECQLTTDYSIRASLNEEFGEEDGIIITGERVQHYLGVIKKQLVIDPVLAISTSPEKMEYSMRFIDEDAIDALGIDSIATVLPPQRRKGTTPHLRFNFKAGNKVIFHSKYGQKTANAFQRGIWIDEIGAFPTFLVRKLRKSTAGQLLLKSLISDNSVGTSPIATP